MINIRDLVSFYQLVDPRDSLPFYVGQTIDPERRLKDYTRKSTIAQHSRALETRMNELARAGVQPIMQELERRECTPDETLEREAYWIQRRLAEGIALVNVMGANRYPVKATYYISPEHDMKLERIRLARRARGVNVDKSALVREAIDLLAE